MKAVALFLLAALLIQIAGADEAKVPPQKQNDLTAVEKLLVGTWYGPSCGGDYTFNADKTFTVKHFTPGNNTLTGTWSIRWDGLPPTLELAFKTSDFQKQDRPEYEFVGKTREQKLLLLTDKAMAFQYSKDNHEWHFSSDPEEGGHVKTIE